MPHLNEASGIAEWERSEEHSVYDTKDGCVCSDAQGQDDNGGCGESEVFQQNTETVFEILEKGEHAQFYLRTDKRGLA
jgi:hypothetical protein